MPAAAVIPAPIAYTKVAAVKTPVAGTQLVPWVVCLYGVYCQGPSKNDQ